MPARFSPPLNVDDFATVNRRTVLRGLGASTVLTTTGTFFTRRASAAPAFSAFPFALGVASGDPAPDGFVIWTKIAPKPLERGSGVPNKPKQDARACRRSRCKKRAAGGQRVAEGKT